MTRNQERILKLVEENLCISVNEICRRTRRYRRNVIKDVNELVVNRKVSCIRNKLKLL